MFKKYFCLLPYAFCLFLIGCANQTDWNARDADTPAGAPAKIANTFHYPELDVLGDANDTFVPNPDPAEIAVILPMTGDSANLGRQIAAGVSMAAMHSAPDNVSITFYDIGGDDAARTDAIMRAAESEPDVFIGPIFAADTKILRDVKDTDTPALSFTSDYTAVGGGVMTMALMPTQSVDAATESIGQRFVIIAPDNEFGGFMAAAAVGSAETYAKEIDGIFYYTPGDSDSIKAAANAAAMWDARTAANTRAREILSDILRLEKLTPAQKTSVTAQLEKISKSDTLGNVSYNAVLLLGNAADSKSAAAFLRYFDVPANLVRFWGTAQWDNSDILTDFSMRGARFATMPAMSPDFVKLYDAANGAAPGRMAGFGFDAAAVAFGMITSPKSASGYLLNPGGFVGLDGIFRFRPNGTSGRAMEIVELNGTDTPKVVRAANTDFISAAGDTNPTNARRPAAMNLKTDGINPLDYIKLPDTLRGKYKSKTFGNTSSVIHHPSSIDESVEILPEDDSDVIIDPTFTPFAPATVSRKPIDEVKILNQ